MSVLRDDPFELVLVEEKVDAFSDLTNRPVASSPGALPAAITARLHGFDLDERPLVVGVPGVPREIIPARSTIALLRQQINSAVLLVFEQGDPRRPIIVGVLQDSSSVPSAAAPESWVSAQVDEQRVVLTAEREIVLKCGDASITLTRAGKVLIKGNYVLSRSSGYNKIKGAAVDIN
jgi:uncharacterized protein DUF6484